MDADGWRHMLLSKRFGESSSDLWQTHAKVAKNLSIENESTFLTFRRTLCHNTEAATGDVLCKKVFLKNLQNSQENTCARVSFLIKLQA